MLSGWQQVPDTVFAAQLWRTIYWLFHEFDPVRAGLMVPGHWPMYDGVPVQRVPGPFGPRFMKAVVIDLQWVSVEFAGAPWISEKRLRYSLEKIMGQPQHREAELMFRDALDQRRAERLKVSV